MRTISAQEWQLLVFFEVEPNRTDADISWPYNYFVYRRTVGDLQITFGVGPADRDFRSKFSAMADHTFTYMLFRFSISDIMKIAARQNTSKSS